MRLNPDEMRDFAAWLHRCGAEILEPARANELFRVGVGTDTVLSVHGLESGDQLWPKALIELYTMFMAKNLFPKLAGTAMLRVPSALRQSRIRTLALRDGWVCWYCQCQLRPSWHRDAEGAAATLEEICPRQVGGPPHLHNQVLACPPCNNTVANLPVVDKVKFRERMHQARSQASPSRDVVAELMTERAGENEPTGTLAETQN